MKPRMDCENGRLSANEPPVRIAVIGQAGVGKSALVVRYLTKRFIWEYDPTLECVYKHQTSVDGRQVAMEILDTSAVHDLEDNGHSDMDGHLSWADGVLIVYSLTDRNSFELAACIARRLTKSSVDMTSSFEQLHSSDESLHRLGDSNESVDTLTTDDDSNFRSDFPTTDSKRSRKQHCVVLVGNKSDLTTERCVSSLTASSTAVDSNSSSSSVSSAAKFFYETSARDGGPEIADAFDGLCRHVLESRCKRRRAESLTTPPSELLCNNNNNNNNGQQSQSDKRRLAVLQTVNKLVRKFHVTRSTSFSLKNNNLSSSSANLASITGSKSGRTGS